MDKSGRAKVQWAFSFERVYSSFSGRKRLIVFLSIILLLATDVTIRTYLALSNDLYGDTAGYAKIAKDIANTGSLSPVHSNYYVEKDVRRPIAYPQFYFTLLALSYTLAEDTGIRLTAAFLGTATVLTMFILMRSLVGFKAAITSALIVSSFPLLMLSTSFPFMESAMTLFMVIGSLSYLNYLNTTKKKYAVAAIIGTGLAIATKQQGFFLLVPMAMHAISIIIFDIVNRKTSSTGKSVVRNSYDQNHVIPIYQKKNLGLAAVVGLALVVGSPFLIYQISTTGTIDNPPASDFTKIFFKPTWSENEESIQWLNNLRGAFKPTPTLALEFMFFKDQGVIDDGTPLWIVIAILIAIGIIFLFSSKNLLLSTFVGVLLIMNFIFMLFFDLSYRYSIFLPIITAGIAGYGASKTIDLLNSFHSKMNNRKLASLLGISTLIILILAYAIQLYSVNLQEFYNADDATIAGRWEDRPHYYAMAGKWVQENVGDDELVMVDRWVEVVYYTDKRILSGIPDEFGASLTPKIYSAETFSEALPYLEHYGIDYIWIGNLQIDAGFYEYISRKGLVGYMEFSPHLEKVYENDIIRIYKIVDCKCDYLYLDKLDYVANIFDAPVDFTDKNSVYIEPYTRLSLDAKGARLLESPVYVHFLLSQQDIAPGQPFGMFFLYSGNSMNFEVRQDGDWKYVDSSKSIIHHLSNDLTLESIKIDDPVSFVTVPRDYDINVRISGGANDSILAAVLVPHDLSDDEMERISNDIIRMIEDDGYLNKRG